MTAPFGQDPMGAGPGPAPTPPPDPGWGYPRPGPGQQQWPGYNPYLAPRTNGLAIAALILAFVFSPAGLVLGIIAKNQIRQTGEDGDGLATAAIVVSAVWLALSVIAVIAFFALFATVVTHLPTNTGIPNGNTGVGLGALLLR